MFTARRYTWNLDLSTGFIFDFFVIVLSFSHSKHGVVAREAGGLENIRRAMDDDESDGARKTAQPTTIRFFSSSVTVFSIDVLYGIFS